MAENITITYIIADKEAFTTYCAGEGDTKGIYIFDNEIKITFEDGAELVYMKNSILSYAIFK